MNMKFIKYANYKKQIDFQLSPFIRGNTRLETIDHRVNVNSY
jgi:hypothetical protein